MNQAEGRTAFQGKGELLIIPPEHGRSYWMPDNGGHANIIVSPTDYPMLGYSMGTQQLAPGEIVPEHFHERHEEMFYVIEGTGCAVLDGNPYDVGAGHTMFFGRNIPHSISNTGSVPLTWVWVFNPPGLELVLAEIGTERVPGEPRPQIVSRPETISAIVSAVTKRGRPSS
jgi:mannose-6-phosphate isomerase-like protein (cupin superfamily)